jgi:hypothetical protein
MGYGDTARDFSKFVPDTCELVRSLAIDHVPPQIRRPWETYNKFCLMRNFPALEQAILVLSSSANDRGHHVDGQVELVDPRGDQQAIMKLMDGVRESFRYELGLRSMALEPCFELVPKTMNAGPWPCQQVSVACI